MTKVRQYLNINNLLIVTIVIFYSLRFHNLSADTTYINDESIYILVGKMGLFEYDWSAYNPQNWIPGDYYLYPSLTAIAYTVGGYAGSRILSLLFGLFTLISIGIIAYFSVSSENKNIKLFSGFVTALIATIIPISYTINKLATADMQSTMLLMGGLACLLIATKRSPTLPAYFLLASLLLLLSITTKIITGLFLPLTLLIMSIYLINNKGKGTTVLIYFFTPLVLGLTIFTYFRLESFVYYYYTQIDQEFADIRTVLGTFYQFAFPVLPLAAAGAIGLILRKKFITLIAILFFILPVILFQIVTHRIISFDRHVYLPVVFLSILSGVGMTELISVVKSKYLESFVKLCFMFTVLFLGWYYYTFYLHESAPRPWYDTENLSTFLYHKVQNGDKVLSEIGPHVALDLYDVNDPTYTYTFDWLEYKNLKGYEAYESAMDDKFFDIIQINGNLHERYKTHKYIAQIVYSKLNENYSLVYREKEFYVYERIK